MKGMRVNLSDAAGEMPDRRRWEPPDATGRSNQGRVKHRLGDFLIYSRQLPVRAYSKEDIEGPYRKFKDMDAFDAWYSTKFHGAPIGVNAHREFTDVLLSRIDDPSSGFAEKEERAIERRAKRMARKEAKKGKRFDYEIEETTAKVPEKKGKRFDYEATADKVFGKKPTREGRTPSSANVTVNGTAYGSVAKAFRALALPMKEHGKFRKELKKVGKLTFKHEKKSYEFKTNGVK